MKLALGHVDQAAHVGTEFLFERREVDVTVAIGVKDVLHEERYVNFGSLDFVLRQVRLEVFVRDEAISISVERSENLEGPWLARAESCVFDFSE